MLSLLLFFSGIPYAKAPLNRRRFKRSERFDGWRNFTTPYEALKEKPICADVDIMSEEIYGSEDCLYLNIYVPRDLKKIENIYLLNLPVMIYIPSRSRRLPDPRLLAHQDNLTVVTLAYRTGVLGFMKLNDLSGRLRLLSSFS